MLFIYQRAVVDGGSRVCFSTSVSPAGASLPSRVLPRSGSGSSPLTSRITAYLPLSLALSLSLSSPVSDLLLRAPHIAGRLLPLPFLSASAWEGGASGLGGERRGTPHARLYWINDTTRTRYKYIRSPPHTPARLRPLAVRLDVRLYSYHTFSSHMYAWSYALLLSPKSNQQSHFGSYVLLCLHPGVRCPMVGGKG